ncbi:MAG: tRNA epoxyqueuosine(34) reductase QueG [Bacteroidota bacterium]
MATVTERIKAQALTLGFSQAGVARAQPLEEEGARLQEWLARGFEATMHWMRRTAERRIDPARLLPGARSVIVLAMNYYTPHRHASDPGTGKISRYAWGDDYHEVVGKRLTQMKDWLLEAFPGSEAKVHVDSGPVMEKVWAQRAGIGWEGKHTNVISRTLGSWIFLGEILTTLNLETDAHALDRCGTCTLCIEACPTRAIVEPYVVDSNLCLSYLTIEHRGPIEGEVRDRFDGWIFGCDVCQDVCPWNSKFAVVTTEPRFEPREGNVKPDLASWQTISADEFHERFRRSAVSRTKVEGLKRNVGIVLERRDPQGGGTSSH